MGPDYIVRWWDGATWDERVFKHKRAAEEFFEHKRVELSDRTYIKIQLLEVVGQFETFDAGVDK